MLNWAILKNPLNWFIVALMVIIAGFGFHMVAKGLGLESANKES